VPTGIQFILDHLEHNPSEEPVESSPFVPSSCTTQHLPPPAIDRVLVNRRYKAKLGPWSRATVETRLAAPSRAHDVYADEPELQSRPQAEPLRAAQAQISAIRRAQSTRKNAESRRDSALAETADNGGRTMTSCARACLHQPKTSLGLLIPARQPLLPHCVIQDGSFCKESTQPGRWPKDSQPLTA
jgi:hypothetical protein